MHGIEEIAEYTEKKFPYLKVESGCLYIVSTPIGSMEDISFRAIYVLKNVDFIASEDTRVTGVLLKHYGIETKQVSYFAQVESRKLDEIIDRLKSGKSAALVSDAGTPCISDPGNLLVSRCIEEGIDVVSIPGASSLIHSLVVSGFSLSRFYFQGFLPQKKGRQKTLEELADIKMPIVIFESKHRIYKTLKEVLNRFGNKEVSVSRELSKKFQQTVNGRVKDLLDGSKIKPKGEFVLVVNNGK